MRCLDLESWFSNLVGSGYDQYPISPKTLQRIGYNCIAYAAGETHRRWWPHPNVFAFHWPPHLPREPVGQETLQNFVRAFESLGYTKCKNGKFKRGVEKIVIFVSASGVPTHASRMLESGRWGSKCGLHEDIQHDSLSAVEGSAYGTALQFMHRRRDGKPFWSERLWAFFKKFLP
jgi:hypothetical protein